MTDIFSDSPKECRTYYKITNSCSIKPDYLEAFKRAVEIYHEIKKEHMDAIVIEDNGNTSEEVDKYFFGYKDEDSDNQERRVSGDIADGDD